MNIKNLQEKHFKLPASDLIQQVNESREHTLALVNDLEDSQFTVPLVGNVNPFSWELGHVAFFYEAFLLQVLDQTEAQMENANDLYNSFEIDHDNRWGLPLPSREETLNYMRRIQEMCVARLNSHVPSAQETYLYLLAVLHEDMHGEAFTYMRQALNYPAPRLDHAQKYSPSNELHGGPLKEDVEIPGGIFQPGATPNHPFVFDNEKWCHPTEVQPFQIARAPVTNVEFAAFVEDGGYLNHKLWSTQGWIWKIKTGYQHPVYWSRGENGWLRRHYNQWVSMEEHAPVIHVSWYEVEAYCNWANRRLPTEVEWEMAASSEPGKNGITERKRRYPWGDDSATENRANLDSRFMGCVDVGAFPKGDSAFGCRQMLGNIWEWTASPFYPYPGYIVDFPYKEYSAPWFGYRKVLKGGAWATSSRLANNNYRNFFQPYRNDIFAGFRTCAK